MIAEPTVDFLRGISDHSVFPIYVRYAHHMLFSICNSHSHMHPIRFLYSGRRLWYTMLRESM
jgi:hypothetical protein